MTTERYQMNHFTRDRWLLLRAYSIVRDLGEIAVNDELDDHECVDPHGKHIQMYVTRREA